MNYRSFLSSESSSSYGVRQTMCALISNVEKHCSSRPASIDNSKITQSLKSELKIGGPLRHLKVEFGRDFSQKNGGMSFETYSLWYIFL